MCDGVYRKRDAENQLEIPMQIKHSLEAHEPQRVGLYHGR
jgi:hypothetical protein